MNFKHLHYFWVAAKAGGVVRAGEQLHTTPQTLSLPPSTAAKAICACSMHFNTRRMVQEYVAKAYLDRLRECGLGDRNKN